MARARGALDEAYIRILLTRGVGELTYNPRPARRRRSSSSSSRFAEPPARTFNDGIRVALVGDPRNHPQVGQPDDQVEQPAEQRAGDAGGACARGADEALMRNQRGELVECSQSNFFIVRDGVVLTPPLDAGLLAGITRAFVFELAARLGVDVERSDALTPSDLDTARRGVHHRHDARGQPGRRASTTASIGSGKPGPGDARGCWTAFRAGAATSAA